MIRTAFSIPTEPLALLLELQNAQREYEIAKGNAAAAINNHAALKDRTVEIKRGCINELHDEGRGVAITRAEKEYVDHPDWKEHCAALINADVAKTKAEDAHSIASQRLFTLREAVKLVAPSPVGV